MKISQNTTAQRNRCEITDVSVLFIICPLCNFISHPRIHMGMGCVLPILYEIQREKEEKGIIARGKIKRAVGPALGGAHSPNQLIMVR